MKRKLYALLVGINDYPAPVPKLRGCINDITNLKRFINTYFSTFEPEIEELKDSEATRQNLIDKFRTHLCQATENDTVLFHYSGHGSRELPAPEFRNFFAENRAETLVCYDSRLQGGYDLADKELAVLISEVAQKNPHIVVVLDCCHSGSGTRDFTEEISAVSRQSNDRTDPRSLSSYLDGWYEKQYSELNKFDIPAAKHILLSACDRLETAKETAKGNGVFSHTLLEVLKRNTQLNYAKLFQEVRLKILDLSMSQTPQVEAVEGFDPYTKFLEGSAWGEAEKNEVYFQSENWYINFGAAQGLDSHKEFEFEIFNSKETVFVTENSLAKAKTVSILTEKSKLTLSAQLDTKTTYIGKLISILPAQVSFFVSGNVALADLFVAAKPKGLVLDFQSEAAHLSKYEIHCSQTQIELWQTGNILSQNARLQTNSRVLIHGIKLSENQIIEKSKPLFDAFAYLYKELEKLVQWQRTLDLNNRQTAFDADALEIDFWVLENGEEHRQTTNEFGEYELHLPKQNGKALPVQCRITARNASKTKMHVALFYLSRKYQIHLFKNEPFEAQSNAVVMLNNKFSLPDAMDETLELLKFVASTDKVDDFLLTQKAIELGKIADFSHTTQATTQRDIEFEDPNEHPILNDWFCKLIKIRVL